MMGLLPKFIGAAAVGVGLWMNPGTGEDAYLRGVELAEASICPPPALSQLVNYTLETGDTLETVAQRYGVLPVTLQGMNPSLRQGDVPIGAEIVIPPFNGIQVDVQPGQTWRQVAEAYNVRADVLFEINGCQATVPPKIFIPGVNWFPGFTAAGTGADSPSPAPPRFQGYPLPETAPIVSNYGWHPHPSRDELVFNSGIALASAANTPVLAVDDGVVAFAGQQDGYGNLVVINHRQGLQTRYANLINLSVTVGQSVRQGIQLGVIAAGETSANSYLYFEVRSNSDLGWVARNPQEYIPALGLQ
ncbi:MAG: M23 family metallopeptidase [Leptolyngbyaceae cyanobacterium MO_188.B28]|nr:M23 family metallopeptidase [Leptolyngbyaceae cyanobacterium MO_188.B28]